MVMHFFLNYGKCTNFIYKTYNIDNIFIIFLNRFVFFIYYGNRQSTNRSTSNSTRLSNTYQPIYWLSGEGSFY